MALGHERDAGAVRRPRGLGVRHRPVGQAAGLAGGHIDQPQVTDAVVLEPGAVEHVVEPVDEAVIGVRRLVGLGLALRASLSGIVVVGRGMRGRDHHQATPVRGPLERLDAARQVGEAARFARPVDRQEVDLVLVLAILRLLGTGRFLFRLEAAVGQECQRPTVGRETRIAVVSGTDRELAGLPVGSRVSRDEPQCLAVAVVRRRHGLERDHGPAAVRRDARFGRDPQPVQVVGSRRSGHPASLSSAVGRSGSARPARPSGPRPRCCFRRASPCRQPARPQCSPHTRRGSLGRALLCQRAGLASARMPFGEWGTTGWRGCGWKPGSIRPNRVPKTPWASIWWHSMAGQDGPTHTRGRATAATCKPRADPASPPTRRRSLVGRVYHRPGR